MKRMILVLTLSLWTTPLVGQHSPRRHSGFTGHVTHLLTVNRDHVAPPAREDGRGKAALLRNWWIW